jgi:fructose PTS system EIIA component
MSVLIETGLVALDVAAPDRHSITRDLAARLQAAGRVTNLEGFLADVRAREEQMPTGLPGGIGIPHARSSHVTVPTLGFARVPSGVDFGAEDGPATLIFLIAAPDSGGADHLKVLSALARRLVHQSFRDALHTAATPQAVVDLIVKEVAS